MIRADTFTFKLFVLVCEQRSISKAAGMMNTAISAASRRLQMLEDETSSQLLKRRPHGVEPTAEGLAVLRYARDVLRLGDQLEAALDEYREGVRGTVRVSASSSALVRRLARDLSAFCRVNPLIQLDLDERPTSQTLEALMLNQADLGVVVDGPLPKGMESFPYSSDRLALAVPTGHPLAERPTIALEELFDEQFVALDNTTAVHRILAQEAKANGREFKVRVQVRSFESMCQMISHGLGVGILPDHAAKPLAESLALRIVPLSGPFAERDFVVVIRAGEVLAPPAARLLEHLLATPN
jgi:DNA-binding transcriptional LysR family regulator